jgi:Mg-chelatase subunit ChlI
LLWPSPRWIISLKKASSVIAYLKWKDEVTIDDVQQVALLALRHRVKCSYLLLSENKDIDEILINKFIKIRDY